MNGKYFTHYSNNGFIFFSLLILKFHFRLEIYSEYQLPYLQKVAYDEMVGRYPDGTIAVLNGNADAASTYIVPVSQNYYSSNIISKKN